MQKDLLEGIVDKQTGDLLDRKGQHVKKHPGSGKSAGGDGGHDAAGGDHGGRKKKLGLVLILVVCAAGAMVWSLTSMLSSTGGIRAYDPNEDVAGPDPLRTTKKNERVETIKSPNMWKAPPQ